MNYLKIDTCDTVNGEGIGVAMWVAGCSHACSGCFNPESWNYKAGKPFTYAEEALIRKALEESYISRFSITGGDPLSDKNWLSVAYLLQKVKLLFPHISVWLWTGYTLEELQETKKGSVLKYVDTLIDGKYNADLADSSLLWRGSSNQRILKRGIHF